MPDASPLLPRPLELSRFEAVPQSLLEVPARDLWRILPGPSVFRIPGRQREPLVVSVLLHGNEDTGLTAIQSVLRRHRETQRARTLMLFVGNVAAAAAGVRTLPGQVDFNRCWPGTADQSSAEAGRMREVTQALVQERPFASIDVHNNTGNNPHYGCINRLDEPFLHLARLFARTVVYFDRPLGVQSAALARYCPALTIECGMPGAPAGTAHAAELIEAVLSLSHFPDHPVPSGDIDILQTFGILKVPEEASLSFDGSDADLVLRSDLDRLNFSELDTGVSLGRLGGNASHRLQIAPGSDGPMPDDLNSYLCFADHKISLARPAVPAMLTVDRAAVRLDCLGYLMHRIGRDGRPLASQERSGVPEAAT